VRLINGGVVAVAPAIGDRTWSFSFYVYRFEKEGEQGQP